MKKLLALTLTLFVGSAFAQNSGTTHMFEFNADSILKGLISFDNSKTKGAKNADTDTQLNLNLNYAYSLMAHPALQLGGRVNYIKDEVGGAGEIENYGFQVGAIYNFMMQRPEDLMNSMYVSFYVGMNWDNTYTPVRAKDEILVSTLALGKRFDMKRMGLGQVAYTPEIALQNMNSTTGSALEYTQNIQLRFLQFAVFF